MSDNVPDFDRMSQDEIMAWMESLAVRQGANEGLTTDHDVDIPEIDPDTVTINGPGYVPYSERSSDTVRSAPLSAAPPSAPPAPVDLPPEEPVSSPAMAVVEPPQPAAGLDTGSLAWLESLAADQNDNLFNLDLSELTQSGGPAAPVPAAPSNPEAWLQELARAQGELPVSDEPAPAEGDTVEWLESLALRQGAERDELVTPASRVVPVPDAPVEPPSYAPFSFETAATARPAFTTEPSSASDPEDFLRSLSADSGYSETGVLATQSHAADDVEDDDVMDAISQGTVTPEQMQAFLDRQMERGLEIPEPEPLDDEEEADDAPVRAELPDWFLQEIGAPPPAQTRSDLPPLESILPAGESIEDEVEPAWLQSAAGPAETFDLETLLEAPDGEPVATGGDPWAEALDLEHEQGLGDIEHPPAWYLRNVSDPSRIARIEGEDEPVALSDEPLPDEADLLAAEQQDIPAWMTLLAAEGVTDVAETIETPESADDDMPDWLRAELEPVGDAPREDWWDGGEVAVEEQEIDLTVVEDAAGDVVIEAVAVTETVVVTRPAVSAPRYAGVASLAHAREIQRTGDLGSSLLEYDALVHASAELDDAVSDLADLARVHRDNPVVHRILGDGYMRQGKLQQALDTYRQALNYL